MIKNKKILVFGSGGSIGGELVRQLAPHNRIYCFDQNEVTNFDLIEEMRMKGYDTRGRTGSIRDEDTITDVWEEFYPEYVFNCAALKVVTPGESNPEEHLRTNALGTYNILRVSKKFNVKGFFRKFIQISSDKAVNPTSIYGMTKLICEKMVKNMGDGYVVVRFGNCMASAGSVLPLWENQINRGYPVTVTDERMERYFMSIPEAVNLLIEATRFNSGTIIFDMGKPVKIIDLAKKLVERMRTDFGKEAEIKIIGSRPGEVLKERLMTEEEESRAVKIGKFWVIK